MLKQLIDYLNTAHIFQFFLAVILVFFYYNTYISGKPSDFFQSLAVVAVSFFFVNQTTATNTIKQDAKIAENTAAIVKIATGEAQKVK